MIDLHDLPKGAAFTVLPDVWYPNHEGIDFYHHYKEDIALFARDGLYRLPYVHCVEPHFPQWR